MTNKLVLEITSGEADSWLVLRLRRGAPDPHL